jgi:hypothetical protein
MNNNPQMPPGRSRDSMGSSARAGSPGPKVAYSPSYGSPWPAIVGGVALLVSIGLVFVGISIGESTVLLPQPRFELVLPQAEHWYIGWIGYVLTPVATITALVFDRVLQGQGLANPQFIERPIYGTVLKVVAAGGILVSLWHILTIAVPLVERVQELGQ